ncbi:MAG TPA: beta-N-acetylhexosaminidase, partial [Fimbriimonas sp.]
MQPEPAIVPRPTSIAFSDGEFLLTPKTKIDVADRNRELGEQLRAFLRPATGLPLEIVAEPVDDAIEIRLDETLSRLGPEGYRLNIEPKQVRIEAYRTAGAFFGIQTLRQLLPPQIYRKARVEGIPWAVPCLRIEDRPRFAWRGALIDSCRHILPKEGILRFLDTLSAHKLNTFHWHLTDDNGWRLEIRKYPKLTEIGAWQPEWLEEYDPPKPKSGTRGGFYSQEDVREIVAYAAALQIDIVPEIEMPGHSGAIVASYPETGVPGSNVLNTEDSTVRFLQDVLDEVMELFPSQFIHVGGDEVDKGPWKNDPRTQELLRQRGLKDENELQSWFIRQMDAYLDSKGRRLVGWDEILEGGLAPGATVMSWRGMQGGIDSAKAGHDVVMTPSSHTYFDYYQA